MGTTTTLLPDIYGVLGDNGKIVDLATDDGRMNLVQAVTDPVTGGIEIQGADVAAPAPAPDRDGSPVFSPLLSVDDLPVVGLNAAGELDFLPSKRLASRIVGAKIRGNHGSNVFNPRSVDGYAVATVQDRSQRVFDVAQLTASGSPSTLLMRGKRPVEIILRYGQSNAGQGGQGGVLLSTEEYPYSVVTIDGIPSWGAYGDAAVLASNVTGLFPAYDKAGAVGARGQFPAVMTAFALSAQNAQYGIVDPGYIALTSWEGSQPLDSFFPTASGHYNYENAIQITRAAKQQAAKYGRKVVVKAIQFTQGEAGEASRSAYATKLTSLLNVLLPGIKAETGQAASPLIMISQTSVTQGSAENYSCMGQWDVCQARADAYMAGPMYAYPLYDAIHLSPLGRMMQGDVEADVYRRIANGRPWVPLQIQSAVRSGVNINVTLEGTPLSEGSLSSVTHVPTVDHLGFTVSGATLTGAAITGANTVQLTCSDTVPSGAVVRYAIDANSANAAYSYRLGNLCVKTRTKSLYYAMGFNVPEFVSHHLCRYEAALA